jgi:hypothetical protein
VYLVASELQSSSTAQQLEQALSGFDATPLLDGAYLVDCPADADALRQQLAQAIPPQQRIWVSRITEEHSGYVISSAAEWLEQRKPL